MRGDVEGKCNERLEIGDDYGDNVATMRCQLKPGHTSPHREAYKSCGECDVVVVWTRIPIKAKDLEEAVREAT